MSIPHRSLRLRESDHLIAMIDEQHSNRSHGCPMHRLRISGFLCEIGERRFECWTGSQTLAVGAEGLVAA